MLWINSLNDNFNYNLINDQWSFKKNYKKKWNKKLIIKKQKIINKLIKIINYHKIVNVKKNLLLNI